LHGRQLRLAAFLIGEKSTMGFFAGEPRDLLGVWSLIQQIAEVLRTKSWDVALSNIAHEAAGGPAWMLADNVGAVRHER
jgi:hypothetical protein